jgi:hypothetical protein
MSVYLEEGKPASDGRIALLFHNIVLSRDGNQTDKPCMLLDHSDLAIFYMRHGQFANWTQSTLIKHSEVSSNRTVLHWYWGLS